MSDAARESMVTQLFPIIGTADLHRSLRFYRDLLGGTVAYEFPGPDGDVVYAGLDIGESHLGIGHDPGKAGGVPSVSLWIYTDDCDATIERLRAAGVPILEEPADQPWGERVALVEDPDGVRVRVATRSEEDQPVSRRGTVRGARPAAAT